MDNVTHACLGMGVYGTYVALTGDASTGAVAWLACGAAVAGAELPDSDIGFRIFGDAVNYLYQHRQASHSIPFWIGYSLLTGAIFNLFIGHHFLLFTLLAFVGVLTHIGSDVLTTYGTKALWPFSGKRIRGDVLFVTEPIFVILAVIGVIFGRNPANHPWLVYTLDGIALLYTLWRWILHHWLFGRVANHVRGMAESGQFASANPLRFRVTPALVPIPHGYKYVVTDGARFQFGSFTWRGEPMDEAVVETTQSPEVAFALENSRVGRAMQWFSPMLVAKQETEGSLTVVRMADAGVRYFDTLSFSAAVDIARTTEGELVLVNEGLRTQSVDLPKSFSDTWKRVGRRMRLTIPTPKGYRSGR
ncbi:metal-dependent hydrolase [Alicyclobacillus acidiphilus]|uniref:metal-dependent hydrolase n=1 Tax=Alicyclobacillus acidiphilus TaxID=182455 RepID=UPI00082F6D3B|nr:metal-dependent hydrolase [Alicyclobacillus acidiphilus]